MFQLPEMILFDYGQTLIDETDYDTIRGNHAVLQRAVSNPRQINALQLQKPVSYTHLSARGGVCRPGSAYPVLLRQAE